MNPNRPAPPIAWAAAAALFAAAAAAAPLAGAEQSPLFRSGVDLVNLGVTVADRKGALVTALSADDFQILEDGRPQAIRYFSTGDTTAAADAPDLHVGVLLDVSGSMSDDIAFMRTASIRFLNMLSDAMDITLVDFDTEVRVARYGQGDFPRVVERIRQQKLGAYTAMYDAVGVYLDGADGQDGRKVMLLYTDGGDTRSSLRFGDLMDLLKASDVTLYAVGAPNHGSAVARAEQRMILQQMAEATGGQAYFPLSIKELDKVYARIEAEIRAQYTLGYVSTNAAADGRWRQVEIKVTSPSARDVRVRARKGYFAPYRAAKP
jgi:VWFA-related protein